LKKDREARKGSDLKSLVPLMREIKFFKDRKLKDKEITEVCYGLKYEHHEPDVFPCKFGDEGDQFYIILKGKCSVWIPMPYDQMKKPVHELKVAIRHDSVHEGTEPLSFNYLSAKAPNPGSKGVQYMTYDEYKTTTSHTLGERGVKITWRQLLLEQAKETVDKVEKLQR